MYLYIYYITLYVLHIYYKLLIFKNCTFLSKSIFCHKVFTVVSLWTPTPSSWPTLPPYDWFLPGFFFRILYTNKICGGVHLLALLIYLMTCEIYAGFLDGFPHTGGHLVLCLLQRSICLDNIPYSQMGFFLELVLNLL